MLTVLIVEDEIELREKLAQYLKFDYEDVYEASSEDEAYAIYRDKKPDILILDINLKVGNGLNLLRNIRQNDHTTKAIVISAYSNQDYLMEAVDLKLSKYIVKPITRRAFKEALDIVQKELSMFSIQNNTIFDLSSEYRWNYEKEKLFYKDKTIKLGSKEHQLLKLLCDNRDKLLTYDDISNLLWDYDFSDKKNSIKIIVKKLRKNLPEGILVNVYGTGYKLNMN
ncbi:MAG: response regulator transcription factor [Campylobacterota bacterium]|nr:response regulator transcription factor [Campylobacterota bacterium]